MTWVSRNRLGLLLLPVALVLAVAASSSRLVHFWLPYVASEVITVDPGETAHLHQEWIDRDGTHVRTVDVTVHSIARTQVVRDYNGEDVESHGPPGTALWRVSLSLAAGPEQVLRGCQLEVEDTQGRRYTYESTQIEPYGVKSSPCLNPNEEGPEASFISRKADAPPEAPDPDARARPATVETVADVLMAGDSVPAKVRIWWDLPVAIDVPISPRT